MTTDTNGWIRVEDRLPEPSRDKYYLCQRVQTSMGGMRYITPSIGWYKGYGRWSCEIDWVHVSHWMELPASPSGLPEPPTV